MVNKIRIFYQEKTVFVLFIFCSIEVIFTFKQIQILGKRK